MHQHAPRPDPIPHDPDSLAGSLMFLSGGGEVGAMMRAQDWSESPLGHPRTWPQALRTVVGLMLNSGFPMFVAWGEELGFLYNDSPTAKSSATSIRARWAGLSTTSGPRSGTTSAR
jgi:hypothetical protein